MLARSSRSIFFFFPMLFSRLKQGTTRQPSPYLDFKPKNLECKQSRYEVDIGNAGRAVD